MSGAPTTEYWLVNGGLVMPYNRDNLSRTPFLFIVNLYAEYSLKLGRTALAFNVNVDNLFNVATATTYWPLPHSVPTLTVTEDEILSRDWELETSGYRARSPASGWSTFQFYPPITGPAGRPLQLLKIGDRPGPPR